MTPHGTHTTNTQSPKPSSPARAPALQLSLWYNDGHTRLWCPVCVKKVKTHGTWAGSQNHPVQAQQHSPTQKHQLCCGDVGRKGETNKAQPPSPHTTLNSFAAQAYHSSRICLNGPPPLLRPCQRQQARKMTSRTLRQRSKQQTPSATCGWTIHHQQQP